MSSSLQNIPNGDNYALGSNAMNSSGGAQCISLSPPMHMLNGILSPTIGSINNLHTISKNETSTRRYVPDTEIAPDYGIIGANNGGVTLQSHHAVPVSSTSNFRHPEYLMTTANPVTQSGSSSHIYTNTSSAGANSSNRISLSNVSPPNTAMRKERFLGSASGPQQHPPVQRGLHSYGQTKHYSPLMPTSTSSSNDSVCDSLSSNNGLGSSIVANSGNSGNVAQHLSARNTNDYALISSQNSSLSPHLGPTCDEVVTATTLPSVSLSCGGTASESTEYPPSKMHRNRDVNQIKRDLSTGTA